MPSKGILDQAGRQRQKQAARDADAGALSRGEISEAELARRNNAFGALNMKGARIVAIGAKAVEAARKA